MGRPLKALLGKILLRRKQRQAGIPKWWSILLFFTIREGVYMLYNGNGYGRTGFGIAVLDRWYRGLTAYGA